MGSNRNKKTQDTMEQSRTTQKRNQQAKTQPTAAVQRNKTKECRNHTWERSQHERKLKASSEKKNRKSAAYLETSELQTTAQQSHHPKNKNYPLELSNQKHNDIWTAHNRNTTKPNQDVGNFHVQKY